MDRREVGWVHGLDRSDSGQGHVAGSCEYGDEPSGCIQCWEFLELLRTFWLRRKVSAPWSYLLYAVGSTVILSGDIKYCG